MLSDDAVDLIFRLLGEGRLTQAEIARRANCSRETVSALKTGNRPVRLRPVQLRQSPDRSGTARCLRCGALCEGECFACLVARHAQPLGEDDNSDLTYELAPAQERRRRELVLKRARHGGLRPEEDPKTQRT